VWCPHVPGAYTAWLIFPALVGIPLFIHQLSAEKVGVVWLPIYAILICLWGTMFFEFWKREQAALAMRWGTSSKSAHSLFSAARCHVCARGDTDTCTCKCMYACEHSHMETQARAHTHT
jgi:hypothetical protein